MSLLSPLDITNFQTFVRRWFLAHGRMELPWRLTADPYHILVSEIMLQQTQVERVIPKYLAFLQAFPDVSALAAAPLSSVLIHWQGLGYNRRAKFLQQAAQAVVNTHSSAFPQTLPKLIALPGVGPYTAAAVSNFAFNTPVPLVETNVRTVFLYHFFPEAPVVSDKAVLELVSQTMSQDQPREWFWALMDYGAVLKRTLGNPNTRSKQYAKQSRFAGSLRQVRGEIIRLLTQKSPRNTQDLSSTIVGSALHFPEALQQLVDEQLVVTSGSTVALP